MFFLLTAIDIIHGAGLYYEGNLAYFMQQKGWIYEKIVIALGGNALQEAGRPATAEEQLKVVEKTSVYIADIIAAGYQVVIAHGNGLRLGASCFRTKPLPL